MMPSLPASALTLLLLSLATTVQSQPAPSFPYDLPPGLLADEQLLPTGREVCVRLGLDPSVPGRCNSIAVLARSMRQTDRSLWFAKTTAGVGVPANCPGPLAFNHLKSGSIITYLCHPLQEVVTITPNELAALTAEVSRLNALPQKTLAEHNKALGLKSEIDCITGRQTEDCD